MTDTCSTCRFGHAIADPTSAAIDHFCRYDTPEFIPPNSSTLKPTAADGWCGRFKQVAKSSNATKSVPAPRSDPNTVRSTKRSVFTREQKRLMSET